jgi:hypothetical protein
MPPLQRLRLDLATGAPLGREELPARRNVNDSYDLGEDGVFKINGGTPMTYRLFPGTEVSLMRGEGDGYAVFWVPAPGARPIQVVPESVGRGYRIQGVDSLAGFGRQYTTIEYSGAVGQLVKDGMVYESVGGGVIVVKEVRGGEGVERLVPPQR